MQIPNQPKQQINPLRMLDNKINSLEWKLMALTAAIERHFPQEVELIERDFFYHKCWSFMMGRQVALRKAPMETKLQISAANRTVIDNLRKEAEEKGWMSEFNKAEMNVAHESKEREC